MQCSPEKNDGFTCFSYDQLKSIAKRYNARNADDKIPMYRTKNKLWKEIFKRMHSVCDDEQCWTQGNKDLLESFRPSKPESWQENPRTWLTNFDIQDVMVQYERKYKTFLFLGVFPSDYDEKVYMNVCVSQELCNLNVSNLLKTNKYQLGIVFNLDPHYLSGSHWVAVYVGISEKYPKKFGFFYYDSNANQPSAYVKRLYQTFSTQLQNITKRRFDLHVNDVRHQFKNTECGMFSMQFIINMLNREKHFKQIIHEQQFDDKIFKLRGVYFND